MATIHRRMRTARTALGPSRIHELCTDEIIYCSPPYYDGYGNGTGVNIKNFISDEMRADWEANREELLTFWRSGKYSIDFFPNMYPHLFFKGSKNTRPWSAKMFDGPKAAKVKSS
jgi:hypothetical protein